MKRKMSAGLERDIIWSFEMKFTEQKTNGEDLFYLCHS